MDYELKNTYGADVVVDEMVIDIHETGKSFLIIYGWHVNGHFICIPNWCVSCEAAEPTDIDYNIEELQRLNFLSYDEAKIIATAIREQAEKQGYKPFETVMSLEELKLILDSFKKRMNEEEYKEFLGRYAANGVYVHAESKLYTYQEVKKILDDM